MPLYLIYHSLLDLIYGLDDFSKNENQIVIMRHECCKKEKACYLYECFYFIYIYIYINSIKTKHYMNKLVNDFDSDNCCFKFYHQK